MSGKLGPLCRSIDFLLRAGVDYAIYGGADANAQGLGYGDVSGKTAIKSPSICFLWVGWFKPDGTGYLHGIVDVADLFCVKDDVWCILPGNRHYRIAE